MKQKKFPFLVYKLFFQGNHKVYIGSSVDFYGRYNSHKNSLRNQSHKNPHLQAAYNKYGEDLLKYEIVETFEHKNVEILRQREGFWSVFYDAYNPKNGYNMVKDPTRGGAYGKTVSEATREKIRKIRTGTLNTGKAARGESHYYAKSYKLYNPLGELIQIKNLNHFCRENGLDCSKMRKVVSGDIVNYLGWRSSLERYNKVIIPYKFFDPEGNVVEGENLRQFCKEQNLVYRTMGLVSSGNIHTHKGWSKYSESGPFQRGGNKNYILKSPEGEIIETSYLKDFCQKQNLPFLLMRHALSHTGEYKGWSLIKSFYSKRGSRRLDKIDYNLKNREGELFHVTNGEKFCKENNLKESFFWSLLNKQIEEYHGFRLCESQLTHI